MNALTQPVKHTHLTTKRGETRKKLITAGRDLIYNKGIENISIQDITEAACLATGSFYNYFDNKNAIIQAIIEDFQDLFSECLREHRGRLNDPAMRVSVTLKYYFTQAQDNEAWRSFIISAGLSDTHILAQNPKECRDDIGAGKKGGRFICPILGRLRLRCCWSPLGEGDPGVFLGRSFACRLGSRR